MSVADTLIAGALPQPAAVRTRIQETHDTVTLGLVPPDDRTPQIAPGQFMMVYAFGIGEVPISVSGLTDDGEVLLTVRRVGATTRAICTAAPGSMLGLRGPFGSRWPLPAASGTDIVIVAGGIGLAPLRMLIREVIRRRGDFDQVRVLYGARTPDELLYTDELANWERSAEVGVTVDAAPAGWAGRIGVVPKLIDGVSLRPERTHAFICGPEVMMSFAVQALLDRDLAPARVHLSLERHMACGIGLCGHCQLGPTLICRDGPVYAYSDVERWMAVREL